MVAAILSILISHQTALTQCIDLREILIRYNDNSVSNCMSLLVTLVRLAVIVVTDCGDSEPVTMSERWDYIMCCQ